MKIYNFIFLLVFVLIAISCEEVNEIRKKKHFNSIVISDSIEIIPKLIIISLKDTNSIKNKYSYGQLIYSIPEDTLTQDEVEKRHIVFVVSGSSDAYDFKSVLKTADDAMIDTTSTDKIEFSFKYKFSKTGKNELKIAVKDTKYLKGKDSSFIETLESNTIYKVPVFVKDSL